MHQSSVTGREKRNRSPITDVIWRFGLDCCRRCAARGHGIPPRRAHWLLAELRRDFRRKCCGLCGCAAGADDECRWPDGGLQLLIWPERRSMVSCTSIRPEPARFSSSGRIASTFSRVSMNSTLMGRWSEISRMCAECMRCLAPKPATPFTTVAPAIPLWKRKSRMLV